MKSLILMACIVALGVFSGAHELLDAHVLSWIPEAWVELAHGALKYLVAALVIAYGILYLYYALKNAPESN